jgi:hypothetical protein
MGNVGKAVVSACKSVYNNVIKPAVTTVYHNVIKPTYEKVIKPLGQGIVKLTETIVDAVATACGYVAEGIHWVDKNITFGLLGGIGKNTIGRIYQFENWL